MVENLLSKMYIEGALVSKSRNIALSMLMWTFDDVPNLATHVLNNSCIFVKGAFIRDNYDR